MKKILLVLSVLFLMSGCGNGTDTLSCSSTTTANGITTRTKYDIDYKDDDVKRVTITYDYNQDTNATTNNATNNNNTTNNNTNNTTTNNNNATNNTTTNNNNATNDNDKMDGVDVDTDGLDTNQNRDNDTGSLSSDDIVDGVVGDVIDGAVNGVTSTILDIAGIKNTYENQLSSYNNIEGFSYKVDIDSDTEYKVIYEIDMDKISDSDLTRFNIDRDFSTMRSNYENSGYTCQ